MTNSPLWDVLILSGGTSSRMKTDKARLKLGSTTLLEKTVKAVASTAQQIVISGDHQELSADVIWCPEDPPQAGPVAAIAAALPQIRAAWVMILPCDLARPQQVVDYLTETPFTSEALMGIDPSGHIQWLTALVKTEALEKAVQALETTDVPVRRLFENMEITHLEAPTSAPDIWEDMDTPEDIAKHTKEFL